MSPLATWLASPPPDAAIEIAADRVAAAIVGTRGGSLAVTAYAFEPLPAGLVTSSLTGTNVHDRPAVARALRRALDRMAARVRRVALVIPDTAAKVSLHRFDHLPVRRDDLEQLVRWQLRKTAPFPVDDACITYSPGIAVGTDGRELIVELARRETVREYETVCEELGLEPGLVETATLALLGLFTGAEAPAGDWLLVHVRPDYMSVVILRGEELLFHRSRPEEEGTALNDIVHQTAMYYQDRLEGRGFTRVLLAGSHGALSAIEDARRSLEERLDVAVDLVDPTRVAALTDRIGASLELMDVLGPLVGIQRRMLAEARA